MAFAFALTTIAIAFALLFIFDEMCKIRKNLDYLYDNIDFQFTDDQDNDENRK